VVEKEKQGEETMTYIDMALEILQKTHDGNDLAPEHLGLLELAVNGYMSEIGEVAFVELYQNAKNGYVRPWFHGIENLTRDHEGFVYWKDRQVEHYSYRDREKEKAAATELAERCRHLESLGVEVTTGNAIYRWEEFALATAA
jgi:hypothetical protein